MNSIIPCCNPKFNWFKRWINLAFLLVAISICKRSWCHLFIYVFAIFAFHTFWYIIHSTWYTFTHQHTYGTVCTVAAIMAVVRHCLCRAPEAASGTNCPVHFYNATPRMSVQCAMTHDTEFTSCTGHWYTEATHTNCIMHLVRTILC